MPLCSLTICEKLLIGDKDIITLVAIINSSAKIYSFIDDLQSTQKWWLEENGMKWKKDMAVVMNNLKEL